jgi:diguanylate cyclase (GGDEF)-like protein/PAS domain S-box-containing protein
MTASSRAAGWIAAVTTLAVVAAHGVWPEGAFGEWSYLVVVDGAAVVAVVGALRCRTTTSVLIAAGVTLSGLGDLVWQLYVWNRGVAPDLSVADVGWLGSYVAVGVALLGLLRRGAGRLDIDGVIDVAAIAVVAMVAQWQLTVQDLVTDATIPLEARIIWASYPALDAVLLGLVVRATAARRLRGPAAWALAGGAMCWLLADFGYTTSSGMEDLVAWLDAGWMLGAALLALATWLPILPEASTERHTSHLARYGSIAVALLPLLVPWIIEVTGAAQGFDPNPVVLLVATSLLVLIAFVRTARSVRAEALVREELRASERFARCIAVNSSDAAAVLDAEARVVVESPQLAAFFGYPDVETRGVDAFSLVADADREDVRALFGRCLATAGQTMTHELRVHHAEGGERWLDVRMVNLLDDPDVEGVVVNLHDITDRKRVEFDLAHQAFHDGLTGLANRALFTDRVEHALRRSARGGGHAAVVFLDLDAFKTVNDSLGHGAGDELLCEVASRLAGSVRTGDTVARLGGDEFAILVEQTGHADAEAEAVADRILASLQEPVTVAGQTVTVSGSLGIACADADATAASLLRDADVAMYRAKAAGKGQWVSYDPDMREAVIERLQLESDLFGALDEHQLRVVYQPVVALDTEEVVGFEALLRWDHPTLGTVPPAKFIPIAEENGLIVPIGRWVLVEACRTGARWNREHAGGQRLSMAVNVSARQLAYGDLLADVEAALADSGLAPSDLVLEVTESSLVQEPQLAAACLQDVRALGVRIAVDDFGTGYSSLSYLRQFPVDILKIDRSFTSTITERGEVPALVRGLLDLGRTLDLATVAEGVELGVQRDGLRAEQCGLAQGFLFARPMAPDAAELLLQGAETTDLSRGAAPTG